MDGYNYGYDVAIKKKSLHRDCRCTIRKGKVKMSDFDQLIWKHYFWVLTVP